MCPFRAKDFWKVTLSRIFIRPERELWPFIDRVQPSADEANSAGVIDVLP